MTERSSDVELPAGGVGVFGGTFNPIHTGHLYAAQEVLERLGLSRVIFIPNARPPHKASDQASELAPAQHRLAWTQLAVQDQANFEVDAIEIERDGPSFAVDTLRAISEQTAPEQPVFIIGRDAFEEIATWKDPRSLFELSNFAVMTRPPLDAGTLADWIPDALQEDFELSEDGNLARHRYANTWIRGIQITPFDISSSEIRARLRQGESIAPWVPKAVYEAIRESGDYVKTDSQAAKLPDPPPDDRADRVRTVLEAASDMKAEDPVALDVREVTSFADTFVVLTGRSARQVKSIADAIGKAMSNSGEKPLGVEGYQEGHWILMDFADLIVHIFGPEFRREYDLERLWSDAPRIEAGISEMFSAPGEIQ